MQNQEQPSANEGEHLAESNKATDSIQLQDQPFCPPPLNEFEVQKQAPAEIEFTEQDLKMLESFRKREKELKQAQENKLNQKRKKQKQVKSKQEIKECPYELKMERLGKLVEETVKRYRKLNAPNHSDTLCARFRCEQKVKLMKTLLIAVEQLRQEDRSSLSQEESSLISLDPIDIYSHVRSIVTEIDSDLMAFTNDGNRQSILPRFQNQWRELNSNIIDEDNFQMRRKVLIKKTTPRDLATCPEKDFYSPAKKDLIRRREEILLLQATKVEEAPRPIQEEVVIQYGSEFGHYKANEPRPQNKMNVSTLLDISNFLRDEYVATLKARLCKELKGQNYDQAVKNLVKVFQS